jgi:hypothetical protein
VKIKRCALIEVLFHVTGSLVGLDRTAGCGGIKNISAFLLRNVSSNWFTYLRVGWTMDVNEL